MYPFMRMIGVDRRARRAGPLEIFDTDVTEIRIWPIDIDIFLELNNGRTLTVYDLGRNSLARRAGLLGMTFAKRWGFVVAGVSVRYRARVRAFQKVQIRTRVVGWDARFIYMEQAIWRGDTCCSHILLRTGVTGKRGLVPTEEVLDALGHPGLPSPELPDWARAWIDADGQRPWPPEF